ncbi:hypothetical protein CDQ84_00805 [Clostridium thermosuccinogenes]|jgi:hypothetical protein|uniref:Trimethylamine corrinoid protein 2 n=1 Tax=Clostridium thermosuccinogenes TaxID=84032 RepID=A0A2K2FS27_9CLOT|nr:hypothetical protein [Pseudoclostridium thermosuccinogenes]AUS97958.1 hypothetical protein CDO33_16795 [Pseudoclostridium thermosuccinogenes]PNU00255.1 hypothetical protein CDQ85_00805 [Pseudoclostridium thermosuccinogenes]PNU01579.1 hypothetical protein CDQ84_00805 [Pseudoclostridium thermosuccinogenes]
MSFSLKPDYEQSFKRYEAFWEREVIDRPPVCILLPVEKPMEVPKKEYPSQQERWLDIDIRAEADAIRVRNYEYYADALPIVWPNMGPGIFSAWCGCGYHFGEDTAWSEPCIRDWSTDAPKVSFSEEHPLFKATVEYTKRLLELGKGNFIVGLTDFHPGGDHLAALRGAENLAVDLIEHPEEVKTQLKNTQDDFFHVYDFFYNMLKSAGMPITSWTPLIHDKRFYIPSNDFSCMISTEMFEEFFIPGIIEECRFYDRSIYHLDGPGAIRHLDSILSIKELDAVQWVPTAGQEGFAQWAHIYTKIQAAGKSVQLHTISVKELPLVFETLKPEGIWFSSITGINDRYTADEVLKRISAWK